MSLGWGRAGQQRQGPARLVHSDRAWAGGVVLSSAALFATTFSGQVSLGDAPESVAGVASLGILHAPGYPAYVLAARLFTLLLPAGDMALRVNLFSAACAALATACVFLLARRVGAGRAGAAIGALALATATSFWFNAGFAKHYAFSALLLVIASLLVVSWTERGGWGRLAGAGAVLGLSTGLSWQLAALAVPGLAVLVVGALVLDRSARPRLAELLAPVVSGLVVAAAVWGFVAFRARQEPAVNWGEATSISRLVDLVTMEDFGFGPGTVGRPESSAAKSVSPDDTADLPVRLRAYTVLLSRDVGPVALALAGVGLVASWRRSPRVQAAFLSVAFAVNLGAAALVVGTRRVEGFDTVRAQGGFLLGAVLVVAVWVALGASLVIEAASRRGAGAPLARATPLGAGVVVAALVLVPSAVVHRSHASHRTPPFASQYATNVLGSLPGRSVLLVWGAERTFPLLFQQVVAGARPDVTVVAADGLGRPWYRQQAARRLGVGRLGGRDDAPHQAQALGQRLRGERPVFLDTAAMRSLGGRLGYRPRGLVGEVVEGSGPQPPLSLDEADHLLARVYATDGVYSDPSRLRFPNRRIVSSYGRAHLELSRAYAGAGNAERATEHVNLARRVDPALVPIDRRR